MYVNHRCPSGGYSRIDEEGKLHITLLQRCINKARKKGYKKIEFRDIRTDLKTVIVLKPLQLRRLK